ncbi:MAG: SDR family NAD(P)-dependent oxidoreductase [Cyanobacteria bacterium K_Offshore_surface_m2_239]|nr:SDR family NAD(P)-dependent oxidoreductase [Cyanobacteria bacterium K_Offshore_surface_m2_239]
MSVTLSGYESPSVPAPASAPVLAPVPVAAPVPGSWTTASIPDQTGRVALVTGANSGLGLETARALAASGATVVMACRSARKAEEARGALLRELARESRPAPHGALDVLPLDLADLASVRAAAATVAERYGALDLLINNAGVMAPPRTLTRDGFELQFGTNHLGHFALTLQTLPLLEARAGARVVFVTSGAQYFGRIAFDDLRGERSYDRWRAYSQSKLANVMTALELQERLLERGSAVLALAAHPGLARTNLQPASVAMNGSWLEARAYRLMDPLFQSAAMGALPQLFAATAPEAVPGGHYGPDQWGGMRGHPKAVPVAPAARDAERRQRLWAVSAELCGLSADLPPGPGNGHSS